MAFAKAKKAPVDMLNGSLWNKIILFALPLAATSILQQLFNSADVAVVGQFSGSIALAAVGVNAPIINVLVNLFVGVSVGSNVLISRLLGAGEKNAVEKAVHTSVFISIIFGFFVGALGFFLARPFLVLLNTQSDIIDLATLYLKIYFSGMPFIMLYNFENAIFRSKGDTRTPLLILVLSGLINVGLNIFFVAVCSMSVDGVALATVIANAFSAVTLIIILMKSDDFTKVEIKKLRIDGITLKQIVSIGIPAGLQSMVFSISNLFMTSAMNSLGSMVVAANTAAFYYDIYCFYVVDAFSQAAVSFIGQNYGAGQIERCHKITKISIGLGAVAGAIVSAVFIIFPRFFLGLYTQDSEVIELAMIRMLVIVSTVFVNIGYSTLSGALRVYGHSLVPSIITIFSVCGVRIAWLYTFFAADRRYFTLCLAWPASWLACNAAIVVAYVIYMKKDGRKASCLEGDS